MGSTYGNRYSSCFCLWHHSGASAGDKTCSTQNPCIYVDTPFLYNMTRTNRNDWTGALGRWIFLTLINGQDGLFPLLSCHNNWARNYTDEAGALTQLKSVHVVCPRIVAQCGHTVFYSLTNDLAPLVSFFQ